MTWLVLKKMLQKRTFPAMLSSKSPDHHVGSGVSGPPAVAVHGVVPAAAAEVIFKGLSFNNVGPIVGAVRGSLFFVISGETSLFSEGVKKKEKSMVY